MERLKIEYKFDLKDFEMMENIEHSYFPNENITPAEEVLNWYKKNNLTCIGLRNSNNEIVAFVNILPLNKKVFYDIYEDKINEADVVYNQIEEYEDKRIIQAKEIYERNNITVELGFGDKVPTLGEEIKRVITRPIS